MKPCPGVIRFSDGEVTGGPCGEPGTWQPVLLVGSGTTGPRVRIPLTDRFCGYCVRGGDDSGQDDDSEDSSFGPDAEGLLERDPHLKKQITLLFANRKLEAPNWRRVYVDFQVAERT